jgi:hypothetical protein
MPCDAGGKKKSDTAEAFCGCHKIKILTNQMTF